MRVQVQTLVLVVIGLLAGALTVGAVVLYAGFYDVAATHQHFRPTFWLLKTGLRESVERRARRIETPPLDDPTLVSRGLGLFDAQCRQCHGAPGASPELFALGMTPVPTNLAYSTRERTPAELYWVIKNGIKMTGMPAWEFRLADGDMWAVVAFLRELPLLSPEQYAMRTRGGTRAPFPTADEPHAQGDPKRGKVALEQYACPTCHRIPGVVGEHAPVGPPLDRIALRQYLAGVIQNTPDNLVQWLRRPQELHPRTAMPNLGVSERDARDMAAYLYTLR
jgi:mono/diheme cytochrome c family protein